jgi:hypothetical protein
VTGRRLKLIAAQAVVVGALMIVVSLTLLQPDEGNPLFDIVAPGGSEMSVGPAREGADQRAGEVERGPADAEAAPGSGAGTAQPPLGLVPAPDSATPPPVAPGYDGDDPTGDQYADAIARLTDQVR